MSGGILAYFTLHKPHYLGLNPTLKSFSGFALIALGLC